MLRDPFNHGIVLVLTPVAAATTYLAADGTPSSSKAFNGATKVAAAEVELGRTRWLAIDLLLDRGGGGLANVIVRASLIRRADELNPSITWSAAPAPLATTVTKAGGTTTTAFEHTFVSADGPGLRLLSSDVLLGGTLLIEVANTGAPAGADKVIVAVSTGGR